MTKNKELHLAICMSDSYFDIYQKIFNRTIPPEFDSVNILHVRDTDATPGLVATTNFKKINYKKLNFIRSQMAAHYGSNLLVLDVDCVIFRDIKDEINSLLEENDMVFQENWINRDNSEWHPYCVATWALKCNDKNINFFDQEIIPRSKGLLLEWPHDPNTPADQLLGIRTPDRESFIFTLPLLVEQAEALGLKLATGIGGQLGVVIPKLMLQTNSGMSPRCYNGDACVVNRAILDSPLGQELKISHLPDTYTVDKEGGPNAEYCALYQSSGSPKGIEEKAQDLTKTYKVIGDKIMGGKSWRKKES